MSEKLLKFLLHELTSVRLTCRKCQTSVDLPLAVLADPSHPGIPCPGCSQPAVLLRPPGKEDALTRLAKAVNDLKTMQDVSVHFVMPDPQSRSSISLQG